MADEKDEMTENSAAEETPEVEEAQAVAEEATPAAAEIDVDDATAAAPAEAADEVAGEAVAEKTVAEEAPSQIVAPPPSGPKPKKKRLPRAQRPVKTRARRAKPAERKPIVRLPKPEHERGRSAERQGTVVSSGMDKTIVVKVDVIKSHPKYKKVVRRSTKFHAHDEGNSAKVGDVVRIVETRPLSKTKRWRLAEIVEVAK